MSKVDMMDGICWCFVQMYDLAYEKAKTILWSNRNVLEKIVEELLEFEILTGKVMNVVWFQNLSKVM